MEMIVAQVNPIIRTLKKIPTVSGVIIFFVLLIIAYKYLWEYCIFHDALICSYFATYYMFISFSLLGIYFAFSLIAFIIEIKDIRSELTVSLAYFSFGLAVFHSLMTIYWFPEWGGENNLRSFFYNFHLIGGIIIIVISRKTQKHLGSTLEVNRLGALPVTGIVLTIISMLFHSYWTLIKFMFNIPGLS